MKRLLLLFIALLFPIFMMGQSIFNNIIITQAMELPGNHIWTKIVVTNDTLCVYYDDKPAPGIPTTLYGIQMYGSLKIDETGTAIDSIKYVNDSIRFYVGATGYSFVKLIDESPPGLAPVTMDLYGFGTYLASGTDKFAYQKYEYTSNSGDLPTILYVDTIPPPSVTSRGFSTGTYSGTFEWCIKQAYPRIVVFEVSGTDDYRQSSTYRIDTDNPYLWVVGRTAPYPGYELKGCMLWIDGSHTLIQDISIDLGDTYDKNNAWTDCISIYGSSPGVQNIVIDHCALSHSNDELISPTGTYADRITVSNCILYEPLGRSSLRNKEEAGEMTGHNFISGTYAASITFYRNLLAVSSQRNPWFDNNDSTEVINDYNWTNYRSGVYMSDNVEKVQIIGTHSEWMVSNLDSADSPQNVYWDMVGAIRSSVGVNFKLYADSNLSAYGEKYPTYDEIDLFYDEEGVTLESSRMWDHGMPIWDASSIDLKDSILAYVGPRYKSVHDERVMDMVRNSVEYYDSALLSNIDLPATTKNWGSTAGDVEHSGFDWGTTNQYFDIRIDTVSDYDATDHTWTSWARITMDENTTTGALACAEINEELGTPTSGPDLSDYVEAVTDKPELTSGDYNYIHLRLKEEWAGKNYAIEIDNTQCATSIDLRDGVYEGYDSHIPELPPREYNSHTFDIPSNPHSIPAGESLTNLEIYLLTTDFAYHDVDYQVQGFGTEGTSYGWYAFATATTPTILHVNTLSSANTNSDATHGSFRWAVTRTYPKIIVFDISGTIDYTALTDNRIDMEGEMWIAGQTAPYPGIEIFGAEFYIDDEDNVLISHMTFSGTDWYSDLGKDELGIMRVTDTSDDIVFSHCTFTASTDGLNGGFENSSTLEYNLYGQPLSFTEEAHYKDGDSQVTGPNHWTISIYAPNYGTFYRNILFNSRTRNPLVPGGGDGTDCYINMVNCFGMNGWIRNLIYCYDDYPEDTFNETYLDYIGNWGTVVNSGTTAHYNAEGQYAGFVSYDLTTSEVYVEDLYCKVVWEGGTSWGGMLKLGDNPPSNEASRIHTMTDSLDILDVEDVKEHLLLHAGPYYKGNYEYRMIDVIRDSTYIGYELMYEGQPQYTTTAFRGYDTVPAIVCNWGSYGEAGVPDYIDPPGYYDGLFAFEMTSGYDFNANNMTFSVNGTSITLDEDCDNSAEVAAHINSELSTAGIDSVEAFVMWHRTNDPKNHSEAEFIALRSDLDNKVLQAWDDVITINTPDRDGSHTGGTSSTVLTDGGASWSTNEFVGQIVYNSTEHAYGVITGNTSTTITCSAGLDNISTGGSEDWDNGDDYLISNPLDFLNGTYQGYYFISYTPRTSITRPFPDIDDPFDIHPDYHDLTNIEVYILTNYPKPGIKENRRSWVKK